MPGHRIDNNHQAVRDALRCVGACVIDVAQYAGLGCDLIAGYKGTLYLIEVKAPGKINKLTVSEQMLQGRMQHLAGVTLHIVDSVEAALKAIGAI